MPLPQKILTRKDEITARYFEILEEHMQDILAGKASHSYHIKDFAERLFIHPTHFSNTIKLTTGKSPCYFMEERLMDAARRMLRETSRPIADICYQLTFDDPTNFTKFFKRFEGKTPRQYRQQFIESEIVTI
ncbi:MAG TPA: AraC family transcriptional regulator [Ohtaekwangia sp.]|uniref:helix-turn-helix domain-containing protein n=1 Tax=Ohtaekwangia sp. TaxID=2066019 RepID=UPI002F945EB6